MKIVIRRYHYNHHFVILLCMVSLWGCSGTNPRNDKPIIWKLSDLKKNLPGGFEILGNPQKITSVVGSAIHFDGHNDAFIYNENPLDGLRKFTIEVIMKPDSNGPFAQRFLHFGEPDGRRVLLEIRNTGNTWYLDAFLNSVSSLVLSDSSKTHPDGEWYNVSFIVDDGEMDTYVNGSHELSGRVGFEPFNGGKTSIGVRLNRKYWYRGDIYEIRITPDKLNPTELLSFKK